MMEIIDIEDENREFQEVFLSKDGWEQSEQNGNDNLDYDEHNAFILDSTFAAIGVSPWYIGKYLKDTVRNDVRVCFHLFNVFNIILRLIDLRTVHPNSIDSINS